MSHYLYIDASLVESCAFTNPHLANCIERHKIKLNLPSLESTPNLAEVLKQNASVEGVVIGMHLGWVGRPYIRLAKQALDSGQKVWLYWPDEEAVEYVDKEKLQSLWRHWLFIEIYKWVLTPLSQSRQVLGKIGRVIRRPKYSLRILFQITKFVYQTGDLPRIQTTYSSVEELQANISAELDRLIENAAPVPLTQLSYRSSPRQPVTGTGVYLRTDFWARISSGGSYGHTCYVAKSLANITEKFVCFMAYRYPLLDELGLNQVLLDPPSEYGDEEAILNGTKHYYQQLKVAFYATRPTYIYERLCLGNYTGVLLSQELNIPYIVEYNGSEISMKRSFEGSGYQFEEIYLKAEEAAFKQAALISVVSEPIKEDLMARGIDPNKILVNPNGADLDAYAPLPAEQKAALRRELGLQDAACVIGFTGTFGGWHGIDVLAEALPKICRQLPEARFLLIGDGNYKHLVDKQVKKHNLSDQVRMVGRVPQQEGARLLKACDIYVSPHNSHMIDSRFFGSPTKIFEYMALGGGIIASNLEQIGQVLSPALCPDDLKNSNLTVSNQRSVLCAPGNVDEFIAAVTALGQRLDISRAIGKNARQAVADYYSWDCHVANLWAALSGKFTPSDLDLADKRLEPPGKASQRIETGDAYKDQVQQQWDNDPAGSHYVKEASQHTLEWYLEVEAYRYGEYAPWMPETMEFDKHSGKQLLEIGGGIGTDLSQFARHGAQVTDIDLSSGHLALAEENFKLRGLSGRFIHHDAEDLPFDGNSFDVVYSNGVIHHTPHTAQVVRAMYRVLKPGGRVIVMVYAENSLHYWRNLVRDIGIKQEMLARYSMGEIMSRYVEITENNARPLVKVYTPKRLRNLFKDFTDIEIVQRQLIAPELPKSLNWLSVERAGKMMGWNLILKANKPKS